MNKSNLYLVNASKCTYEEIANGLDINSENSVEVMNPYCKQYFDKLSDENENYIIFSALEIDGKLQATYRASYADWLQEEDEPYFYDVAEHNEVFFFNSIVSLKYESNNPAALSQFAEEKLALFNSAKSATELGKIITESLEEYQKEKIKMKNDKINEYTEKLKEAAMLLSSVGDMTEKEGVDYLASVMQDFNKSVEESISIIDGWDEISNNYGVTSKTMAKAITQAGSSAKTVNVSFDELNGMITAIAATTKKSGNEIGNALKTSFTRLLTSEAQDALNSVNIEAIDSVTGDYRSATIIFGELSEKWEGLTDAQKNYVANAIASKFHKNTFMVLIVSKICESTKENDQHVADCLKNIQSKIRKQLIEMSQALT